MNSSLPLTDPDTEGVHLRFDMIVIGAGPAGWSAALQGAKLGFDVAIVERNMLPGGACVHTGTIPSKSLRKTILDLMAVRRGGEIGVHATYPQSLSMSHLLQRTDASSIVRCERFTASSSATAWWSIRVAALDGLNRL